MHFTSSVLNAAVSEDCSSGEKKVCLISLQLWPGGGRCDGRAFNENDKDGT